MSENNAITDAQQRNGTPKNFGGGDKPKAERTTFLTFNEGPYEGYLGLVAYFNDQTMKHDEAKPSFWIRFPGRPGEKPVYLPLFENKQQAALFCEFIEKAYEVMDGITMTRESTETRMDDASVNKAKAAMAKFKQK